MQRGLLTGIFLGVAMTIFALQNAIQVPVKFLWMKFNDVPLALILVISVLVGLSITAVFSFIDKQKLKSKIRRLQNRIVELKEKKGEDEGTGTGESREMISDDGMTIEGEPGHKFFDD